MHGKWWSQQNILKIYLPLIYPDVIGHQNYTDKLGCHDIIQSNDGRTSTRFSVITGTMILRYALGAVAVWHLVLPIVVGWTWSHHGQIVKKENNQASRISTIDVMKAHGKSSPVDHVTLAGDYSIVLSTRRGYRWSMYPIDQVVADETLISEGSRSVRALSSSIGTALDSAATISHTFVDTDLLKIKVTVQPTMPPMDLALLDLLQRIYVQWALETSFSAIDGPIKVVISRDNKDSKIMDLSSNSGVEQLFDGLVDPSDEIEWVEMVTENGHSLGKVPRRLVHSFNLLHRGIGLFVTKDRPINSYQCDNLSIYVHRRSATKRIFPSLYDMFVGGVSLADEPPEVTARREVAEELGLSRALDDTDALTGPILKCIVCTAYNRCVVTLFSYTMKSHDETVTWQEEEVDWGCFVPYPVIVAAADRSIQRFANKQAWPGTYPPFQSSCKGSLAPDTEHEEDSWTDWDFVPDGLLVWEAWLRYFEGKKIERAKKV